MSYAFSLVHYTVISLKRSSMEWNYCTRSCFLVSRKLFNNRLHPCKIKSSLLERFPLIGCFRLSWLLISAIISLENPPLFFVSRMSVRKVRDGVKKSDKRTFYEFSPQKVKKLETPWSGVLLRGFCYVNVSQSRRSCS